MGKRVLFFLYYYFFWVLYFAVAQLVFLFYHNSEGQEDAFTTWLKTIYFSLSMHFSATAAIMVLPALVLLFTTHIRGGRISSVVINIYTCVLILLFSILFIFDLELYQQNGVRLDGVSLQFLENEGLSWWKTLNVISWVRLVLIFLSLCVVFIAYYFESVGAIIAYFKKANILSILLLLLCGLGLYFPLTHGIGVVPLSAETAPFAKTFYNDAVQNPIWQVGYYFIKKYLGVSV